MGQPGATQALNRCVRIAPSAGAVDDARHIRPVMPARPRAGRALSRACRRASLVAGASGLLPGLGNVLSKSSAVQPGADAKASVQISGETA